MNFPAYVPAAVRLHVLRLLPVLTSIIETPRGKTPCAVRQYFKEQNTTGAYYERRFTSFVDEHLATVIDKWPFRRDLELHKNCLIRLVEDERMREAYRLLAAQFSEDESWHQLVWAATAAALDFRKYRIGFSNASALCRHIEEISAYLAFLLEQLPDCQVHVPDLYSLSLLINKQGSTYDDLMPDIPGLRVQDVLEALAETAGTTASDIDNRTQDSSNPFGWRIAYSGCNSPVNALVMRALETRQSNPKTEYLRAFGRGLELKDANALTPAVQRAMAHIATVVINDPDVVVTFDDVRAVFKKGRQRVRES